MVLYKIDWGEDGYSLLETLIAFAIMSAVLVTLLPAQSKLFTYSANAEEKFLASEYALSHLDRMVVLESPSERERQLEQGNWIITETIQELSSNSSKVRNFWISLKITNSSGNELAFLSKPMAVGARK